MGFLSNSSLTLQSKSVRLRGDFSLASNNNNNKHKNKKRNPNLIIFCKQTIYCQTPVKTDSTVQDQGTTAMDGQPPSLGLSPTALPYQGWSPTIKKKSLLQTWKLAHRPNHKKLRPGYNCRR